MLTIAQEDERPRPTSTRPTYYALTDDYQVRNQSRCRTRMPLRRCFPTEGINARIDAKIPRGVAINAVGKDWRNRLSYRVGQARLYLRGGRNPGRLQRVSAVWLTAYLHSTARQEAEEEVRSLVPSQSVLIRLRRRAC